ncbi:MAG: DUF4064 domain-containing protein [Bacteroidetes bacterium]|nr:DUF4064 domain-containing protein [Bacteroidota bacterium]
MSKVIAGIFTIVGGLLTFYFSFVMQNSSYNNEYNDPKLHMSLFQTGNFIPLVVGILLLTIGLAFFFLAKEPNPNIK